MTKYKVSELEGALLDAAVSKAAGCTYNVSREEAWGKTLVMALDPNGVAWWPSSRWEHGGPIIERERIDITYWAVPTYGTAGQGAGDLKEPGWCARLYQRPDCMDKVYHSPTPLVAAMRAYVASKFGEEVELP